MLELINNNYMHYNYATLLFVPYNIVMVLVQTITFLHHVDVEGKQDL